MTRIVRMLVPGITTANLNRSGYGAIWSLGDISVLAYARYRPLVSVMDTGGSAMVAIGTRINLTPDFYSRGHYFRQVRMEGRVSGVGRTSFVTHEEFSAPETGKLLWTTQFTNVLLDSATFRPKPFPEALRAQYPPKENDQDAEVLRRMRRPARGSHTLGHVNVWSSADLYHNVHNTEYARFAHDAASELCARGHLVGFSGDLANYGIASTSSSHQGPSGPGDRLEVHVWQSTEDPTVVKFHICKEGEDSTIYTSIFKFYPKQLPCIGPHEIIL